MNAQKILFAKYNHCPGSRYIEDGIFKNIHTVVDIYQSNADLGNARILSKPNRENVLFPFGCNVQKDQNDRSFHPQPLIFPPEPVLWDFLRPVGKLGELKWPIYASSRIRVLSSRSLRTAFGVGGWKTTQPRTMARGRSVNEKGSWERMPASKLDWITRGGNGVHREEGVSANCCTSCQTFPS